MLQIYLIALDNWLKVYDLFFIAVLFTLYLLALAILIVGVLFVLH